MCREMTLFSFIFYPNYYYFLFFYQFVFVVVSISVCYCFCRCICLFFFFFFFFFLFFSLLPSLVPYCFIIWIIISLSESDPLSSSTNRFRFSSPVHISRRPPYPRLIIVSSETLPVSTWPFKPLVRCFP